MSSLLDGVALEPLPEELDKESEIRSAVLRNISYSALNLFNLCERKFFLERNSFLERDSTVDTAFGKAVAAGVQELWLSNGNILRAKAATFFAWDVDFYESGKEGNKKKKSIAYALQALEKYLPFYQILSREWKIATIDGVPAVEYSLLIEFPNGFRYRSYVDLILQSIETGIYKTVELKTTAATWEHEASYANSSQATSYTLVLDQIAPDQASYWVEYPVYYSQSQEWQIYPFPKSLLDKAKWLKTMLGDIERIQKCETENFWPQRGQSCMAFGRPCAFFGVCGLQDRAVVASSATLQEKVEKEEEKKYSFVIPLKQILENYLK